MGNLDEVSDNSIKAGGVDKQRMLGGKMQFGPIAHRNAPPLGTNRTLHCRGRGGVTHQSRPEESRTEPLGDVPFKRPLPE